VVDRPGLLSVDFIGVKNPGNAILKNAPQKTVKK